MEGTIASVALSADPSSGRSSIRFKRAYESEKMAGRTSSTANGQHGQVLSPEVGRPNSATLLGQASEPWGSGGASAHATTRGRSSKLCLAAKRPEVGTRRKRQ